MTMMDTARGRQEHGGLSPVMTVILAVAAVLGVLILLNVSKLLIKLVAGLFILALIVEGVLWVIEKRIPDDHKDG